MMKGKMRFLLVFALAIVASLAIAIPAFATSTATGTAAPATASSTATVTVATGNAKDALSAYKVVDATLDTSANTLTYSFTTLFTQFQAQNTAYASLTPDDYCAMKTDSDQYKALLGAFTAYIKGLAGTPAASYTETTDDSGSATFAGMAMGQYIILGSGNTTGAIVYQTVTAEVVPTAVNGTYVINPTYSVTMKTTTPTGEKTLDRGTVTDGNYETASIGDVLTYTLHGTVPTYSAGATNTTYYMGDVLSNGLTLKSAASEIVVKGYTSDTDTTGTVLTMADATNANDYTVTIDGQKLYIDYNYANIAKYQRLTATYEVVLNNNAKVGTTEGNPNTYTLVWSNSPFDGTTSKTHPDTKTPGYGHSGNQKIVYTYALYINKYDEVTPTDKLQGAVFEIHAKADCTDTAIATVTTDKNGYAAYTGLEKGTYYLKEVTAPTGYKLATTPTKIDLSASSATSTVTTTTSTTYTTDVDKATIKTQALSTDGVKLWLASGSTDQIPTASATQPENMLPAYVLSTTTTVTDTPTDGAGAGAGFYSAGVSNAKGGNLPTTGGMGTTIFYIIGAVLVIGAIVALITKKRMASNR